MGELARYQHPYKKTYSKHAIHGGIHPTAFRFADSKTNYRRNRFLETPLWSRARIFFGQAQVLRGSWAANCQNMSKGIEIYCTDATHSRGIISPVLISVAAFLTRVGVNRLRRPIWKEKNRYSGTRRLGLSLTKSLFPQTHAASFGAPSMAGKSFLRGNDVESGSKMIVAVVPAIVI